MQSRRRREDARTTKPDSATLASADYRLSLYLTHQRQSSMAKFVFGMNVSLDGYVDHDKFAPDSALFRHWVEQVGA
jgi:hypothetical protein